MRFGFLLVAFALVATSSSADPVMDRLQLWGCLEGSFENAGKLKQRTAIRCFQKKIGAQPSGVLTSSDRAALETRRVGSTPKPLQAGAGESVWTYSKDSAGEYATHKRKPVVSLTCTKSDAEPPLYFSTALKNVRGSVDVTLRFDGLVRALKTPKDQSTNHGARAVFTTDWKEEFQEIRLSAGYSSYLELSFPQARIRLDTAGLADVLDKFDPECGTPEPPKTSPATAEQPFVNGPPLQPEAGFGLELAVLDPADGLLRVDRADTPYLAALGIQPGAVIVEVQRFDPTIETARNAAQARDFLMNASGEQQFVIKLKPDRPELAPRSIDLFTPIPVGGLKLDDIRAKRVLAQIQSGDMVMARQSKNRDRDIRSGRKHFLNGLFVHYHTVFGQICFQPGLGPYHKLTERLDRVFYDRATPYGQKIQGQEFEYRIRSRYVPLYNRAKLVTPGLRGYWRNLDLDWVPEDLARFIRNNGCDSPDLRRFEENFAQAVTF